MSALSSRFIIIFITIILFSGCAGNKVLPDFDPEIDFSQYKSYRWKSDKANERTHAKNPFVHSAIIREVDKELKNRDYFKNDKPDFIIDYYLTVETRQSRSSTSIGFGTSRYSGGSSVGIGMSMPLGSGRVEKEVTLVIEILDSVKKAVTWRAASTEVFSAKTADRKTKEKIQESVKKILATFPPLIK